MTDSSPAPTAPRRIKPTSPRAPADLAAARRATWPQAAPVVVQDTGFSELIPTGRGLIAFATLDEAAQAVEAVGKNYREHQEAARGLARTHFDSQVVIGQMLERIGL